MSTPKSYLEALNIINKKLQHRVSQLNDLNRDDMVRLIDSDFSSLWSIVVNTRYLQANKSTFSENKSWKTIYDGSHPFIKKLLLQQRLDNQWIKTDNTKIQTSADLIEAITSSKKKSR